jgi:hypothetical protein
MSHVSTAPDCGATNSDSDRHYFRLVAGRAGGNLSITWTTRAGSLSPAHDHELHRRLPEGAESGDDYRCYQANDVGAR